MAQESESQSNPAPPESGAETSNSPVAVHEGEESAAGRSALKKYALWFLRLPATVAFLARRYLGIAVLKARIQCVRHFSLSAAFRSLGRVAYSKQAAADTLATQYAEIKELQEKLDEKQKPTTTDGDNSTWGKIGLKFKNLLRRLQTILLARRLNGLLVSLGKSVATDEAVGAQFCNEWSNLRAVRTKMAALKEREKAFAECVPSETDFTWWPRTIPGCLTVLAILGAVLWRPEHRLYGITLAYFLISGSRYLWFSMTVPADRRPKFKWWRAPGAVAAFASFFLAVYGSRNGKNSEVIFVAEPSGSKTAPVQSAPLPLSYNNSTPNRIDVASGELKDGRLLQRGMLLSKVTYIDKSKPNGSQEMVRGHLAFINTTQSGELLFLDLTNLARTSPLNLRVTKNSPGQDINQLHFEKAVYDKNAQLPPSCRQLLFRLVDCKEDLKLIDDSKYQEARKSVGERPLMELLEDYLADITKFSQGFHPRKFYVVGKVSDGLYEVAPYEAEIRGLRNNDLMKAAHVDSKHYLLRTANTQFQSKGVASVTCEYIDKIRVKLTDGFEHTMPIFEERNQTEESYANAGLKYYTIDDALVSAIRYTNVTATDIDSIAQRITAFVNSGPQVGSVTWRFGDTDIDVQVPPRLIHCSSVIMACAIKCAELAAK